ncbi:glutaredoxin family protein [Halarsenatibacter silvermanii]|uniref:Glutaredoxin 3 n=1 Tax=Halarsenatibacter silvermanii TaxID=321763 RepID=A0A1G9IV78_9FIRM|nr:glutaredoxin family protein [Halarsenatibacter silvermanii]SDL28986.1 glutaredoxin 3 [Halarsenatibacter silvermanii]
MPDLTIYTKDGCPFCQKAIDHYREKNVEFEEINTSEDKEARRYAMENFGVERVPVIVREGELEQIGFGGGG